MTSGAPSTGSHGIGDVARRTGMSVHALRFYEHEGLLIGPVHRNGGGRRRYSDADVEWIMAVARLRETGMPVADIKHLAALLHAGSGNERERLQVLERHQRRIDAQMAALTQCREMLTWKVDLYREHLAGDPRTPLWDPTRAGSAGEAPNPLQQ